MKKIFIISLIFFFLNHIFLKSQSVTFTKQLPKNDEVCESLTTMKMNIELNILQNNEIINTLTQSYYRIEKKDEIILESDKDNIKKVKIYYHKSEETNEQNNEKKKKVFPVSEKTYIIENINNNNAILYINGDTPPEEEIKYIENDYKDINYNFATKGLDNITLEAKERVPALESELLKEFDDLINKEKGEIDTEIYYKKNDFYNNINCALFDIKITILMPLSENIEIKFEMTGQLFIDIDTTWPILVKLIGPITAKGFYMESEKKQEMKGQGNIELIFSNNFSRYYK